ncbi:hypothetical protein D4764_05G0014440 [Takifugu flavidus]|uniref:NACHT domain-containing protein n=1 Tax=Takifugu flavidus TaxID=433684 RepID=A0A5C6N1A1_9TELE|nr:hypothetical protein D4764_05G0014440 [Takifugu flavidus]
MERRGEERRGEERRGEERRGEERRERRGEGRRGEGRSREGEGRRGERGEGERRGEERGPKNNQMSSVVVILVMNIGSTYKTDRPEFDTYALKAYTQAQVHHTVPRLAHLGRVDTSNNGPRNWEPNKPVFQSIPFRLSRKTEDRQGAFQNPRGKEERRERRGKGERKGEGGGEERKKRGGEERNHDPVGMDEDRAESTVPSCVSLKSDHSKGGMIKFRSSEEMFFHPINQRTNRDVFHSERGEHILSNWDQAAPPGESSCSQSGSRSGDAEMKPKQRTHEAGSGTLLNKIYTELYITEGQSEEVDTQHEVRQLERTSKKNIQDTPIKCQDIFKVLSEQQRHIRVVLTNGVAGVGKTFSVQKFSLDWAEGLENQDISLVLPLSCRELNLIRDEQHSLLSLLHVFHPTLQKIRAEDLTVWKLLFIFDGLDESRFSLGFNNIRSSLMSHKYRQLRCSW